jgi:hypothetical protein
MDVHIGIIPENLRMIYPSEIYFFPFFPMTLDTEPLDTEPLDTEPIFRRNGTKLCQGRRKNGGKCTQAVTYNSYCYYHGGGKIIKPCARVCSGSTLGGKGCGRKISYGKFCGQHR